MKETAPSEHRDDFLEELIVRRELSDNFCFYQPDYDKTNAFHPWAQRTLADHQQDQRDYLYTRTELEGAQTHDILWNAAQQQMKLTGSLHGYLRMYWAKKILEWTPDAVTALADAIYLNDKYFLDGRDPNGYAGIAWSIGGVHDRAWANRKVFGKIRYMNAKGCRRKFDVDAYIQMVTDLMSNQLHHI
jgi:deoxyribodipyrimidine photo-lyase